MEDADFIVLGKYKENDKLTKGQVWDLVAHKRPHFYSSHAITDQAVNKLLTDKFIEFWWTNNADITEYKISDLGREAYDLEKENRRYAAKRKKLEDRLLETSVINNRASPQLALLALVATVGSVLVSYWAYKKPSEELKPSIQRIDTTMRNNQTELNNLRQTMRSVDSSLRRIADSLKRK
ncbi:MAG: hypothetical protein E6H09_11690 [Bacteroidetes bacterium]|jgi:hypothetical protein|nr:MAG: hypothetical protein E6H09_11690 [Bacteroidota bacterium]